MADVAKQARLRFLKASSECLMTTAPATSAHLMQQHNAGAIADGKPDRTRKGNGSCKACGTILVPGWSSRTSIIRSNPPRKGGQKAQSKTKIPNPQMKSRRIECLSCHRFEQTQLPIPPARKERATKDSDKKTFADTTHSATSRVSAETVNPASTNAGSKQRAKARKGGLQAILEKSKASKASSNEHGLGLLDLMKAG